MKIDDIKLMYEYNDWANQRILSTAAQVSQEQLMMPTSFSWGSLHGTLVHTLDTENGWRILCQNRRIVFDIKPEDFPDFPSIQARWDTEKAEWWTYLNSLTDDDLQGTITYEVPEGRRNRVLWHCLWHVVNHGMQHRSESAAMLTNFGSSPGDLDFTQYLGGRGMS